MPFVHLHTHSEYSLLDGANRIPELVAHVKKLGMDSLAVTDHGNMHAAWTLLRAGQGAEDPADSRLRGLPRLRAPAGPREAAAGRPRRTATSCCWPRTGPGTRTWSGSPRSATPRGSTAGRGSTRRCSPRTRRASSAWPPASRARWRSHLRQGKYEEARRSAEWFARLFGPDGFWLEIQQHGIAEERLVTEGMLRLGRSWASAWWPPTTPTTSGGRTPKSHDVLLAIGTGSDLDDPKRFRFTGQESYVKSEAEMRALFPDHPETLANTARGGRPLRVRLREALLPPRAFPAPPSTPPTRRCSTTSPARGAERRYGIAAARRRSRSGWPTSSASSTRRATPATS